ncbi:MAG: hypothetical protein ABSB54_07845 [Acidimicrobiales bacterium]|jgi:hypothetical protein
MKKTVVALVTFALITVGSVAIAVAAGAPRINEANAGMQLAASKFTVVRCTGVKGITYETWRGTWKGGETDHTPGSTPYNLSGPITIKNIVWTINLKTDRGVLRGTTVFHSDASSTLVTYSGPLTLITQGLPSAASGASVQARGWINAATFTKGVADGGSLLANVEFNIGAGLDANAEFGNTSLGIQDFSVATDNQTC